jgi:uncharacterized PurR-regulated membrane protein YhhQ (DUF165 family)
MTLFWWAAYVGCIFAANLAIKHWGIVPVGLGVAAPAGVYFAGLALTARDQVRERSGFRAVVAAVLVGAVLSWWLEDIGRIALASGIAFGISETADSLVYEPLRKRWATAVLVSGAAGLIVDSVLFLWIAFGSLAFIDGQIVGKAVATLAAVGMLSVVREWRR